MAQATRAVEVGEAPAWQSLCLVRGAGGSSDAPLSLAVAAECPDQSPELQPWSPGHDPGHRVHIGRGRTLLLTSSATVNSIHVSEGGKPASPRRPSRPRPRSPAGGRGSGRAE